MRGITVGALEDADISAAGAASSNAKSISYRMWETEIVET